MASDPESTSFDDGRVTTYRDEGTLISGEPNTSTREIDPVCGMEVDSEKPETSKVEHGGQTYYFCSADCRGAFEEDPDRFAV
jgi:YHS domain-containing protein